MILGLSIWLFCGLLGAILLFVETASDEITIEDIGFIILMFVIGCVGLIIILGILISEHKNKVILRKSDVKKAFSKIFYKKVNSLDKQK